MQTPNDLKGFHISYTVHLKVTNATPVDFESFKITGYDSFDYEEIDKTTRTLKAGKTYDEFFKQNAWATGPCGFTIKFEAGTRRTNFIRIDGREAYKGKKSIVDNESETIYDVKGYYVAECTVFHFKGLTHLKIEFTKAQMQDYLDKLKAKGRTKQGEKELASGNYKAAAKLFKEALSLARSDVNLFEKILKLHAIAVDGIVAMKILNDGKELFNNGEFDKGDETFDRAAKLSKHDKFQEILAKARKKAAQDKADHNAAKKIHEEAKKNLEEKKPGEALRLLNQALTRAKVKTLINFIKSTKFDALGAEAQVLNEKRRRLQNKSPDNYKEVQQLNQQIIILLEEALLLKKEDKNVRKALQLANCHYKGNKLFNSGVELERLAFDQYKNGNFEESKDLYEQAQSKYKEAGIVYKSGSSGDEELKKAMDVATKHEKSVYELVGCIDKKTYKSKIGETDYTEKKDKIVKERDEEKKNDKLEASGEETQMVRDANWEPKP